MTSRIALAWLSLFFFVRIGFAAEQDYATRFAELKKQKDAGAQIDALLDEWRAKQPDSPEAWITSANYYFNLSVGPNISTKPPEKGDFTLSDKKNGKATGSISFKPNVVKTSRRAADLLEEAVRKFPDRLDIWCGLSWTYQESGDFDNELVDDQRFLKIAILATEEYPNHPYAFNDVALYYSNMGDRKKTHEWLEKAHQIDPKDGLILYNLGKISADVDDKAAARKWFEESIKADPDGDHVEAAKEALKKLKK